MGLRTVTNLGRNGAVKTTIAGWPHTAHFPRWTFGGGLYVSKVTDRAGGSATSAARCTRMSA
jgi:hypothetical protein